VFEKLITNIIILILESVEELKLRKEENEIVIKMILERLLTFSEKYRIITDKEYSKCELQYWKTGGTGLIEAIDSPISICFSYDFD